VVFIMAVLVALTLVAGIWGGAVFLRHESGNIPALLNKMAEIIADYKSNLPEWLASYIPGDAADLKESMVAWLHEHAKELQTAGKEAGLAATHILIGIALGVMLSLRSVAPNHEYQPLAQAWVGRIVRFGDSFRAIVFAQVRISAINTVLTAIYLIIILPLFGIHLPLIQVMLAVTFFTGLIPVVGNLISNTIITVVSLSHSPAAAAASIAFLLVIHKLEYFLNARIVGESIKAHAWELLIAMFVMEAAFGIEGVIAAPIYYAYIKGELVDRGLV
jgi:predicted PurR-regulated permease PerM